MGICYKVLMMWEVKQSAYQMYLIIDLDHPIVASGSEADLNALPALTCTAPIAGNSQAPKASGLYL